jgi:hypothetical protein
MMIIPTSSFNLTPFLSLHSTPTTPLESCVYPSIIIDLKSHPILDFHTFSQTNPLPNNRQELHANYDTTIHSDTLYHSEKNNATKINRTPHSKYGKRYADSCLTFQGSSHQHIKKPPLQFPPNNSNGSPNINKSETQNLGTNGNKCQPSVCSQTTTQQKITEWAVHTSFIPNIAYNPGGAS